MKKSIQNIICFSLILSSLSLIGCNKRSIEVKKISTKYTQSDILLNNLTIKESKDKTKISKKEIIVYLRNKVKITEQLRLSYDTLKKINGKNYHVLHYYRYNKQKHQQTHINWFYVEDNSKIIYKLDTINNILRII